MKIFKMGLILFAILLFQSLLEGILYKIFLVIINASFNGGIGNWFDTIIRYSGYRFSLTVLPYTILMLIVFRLLRMPNDLSIGISNLITNSLIVGFIWFLEGSSIFDEKILFTTVLVGLIMLVVLFKTKLIARLIV
jgi:hypothetical protein